MKRLFLAFLLFLCAPVFAQVHPTWTFSFFNLESNGVRRVEITPVPWGVSGGSIITGDRLRYTNLSNGSLTVSNMATNMAYRVEFQGPFSTLSITNYFGSVTGAVNAADYLTATNLSGALAGYTIAQANSKFAVKSNALFIGNEPKLNGTNFSTLYGGSGGTTYTNTTDTVGVINGSGIGSNLTSLATVSGLTIVSNQIFAASNLFNFAMISSNTYWVDVKGSTNGVKGDMSQPFYPLSEACKRAQPGEYIVVNNGTFYTGGDPANTVTRGANLINTNVTLICSPATTVIVSNAYVGSGSLNSTVLFQMMNGARIFGNGAAFIGIPTTNVSTNGILAMFGNGITTVETVGLYADNLNIYGTYGGFRFTGSGSASLTLDNVYISAINYGVALNLGQTNRTITVRNSRIVLTNATSQIESENRNAFRAKDATSGNFIIQNCSDLISDAGTTNWGSSFGTRDSCATNQFTVSGYISDISLCTNGNSANWVIASTSSNQNLAINVTRVDGAEPTYYNSAGGGRPWRGISNSVESFRIVGPLSGNGSGLTNLSVTPANLASTNFVRGTTNFIFVIQGTNSYWTNTLPMGTLAVNSATAGAILTTDGTSRIWTNALDPSLLPSTVITNKHYTVVSLNAGLNLTNGFGSLSWGPNSDFVALYGLATNCLTIGNNSGIGLTISNNGTIYGTTLASPTSSNATNTGTFYANGLTFLLTNNVTLNNGIGSNYVYAPFAGYFGFRNATGSGGMSYGMFGTIFEIARSDRSFGWTWDYTGKASAGGPLSMGGFAITNAVYPQGTVYTSNGLTMAQASGLFTNGAHWIGTISNQLWAGYMSNNVATFTNIWGHP